MIAIRYTLKLLEPLLATALQSDPNSAISYPFIPGSLIRGALIGEYLVRSNNAEYFAVNQETRRRFLDGATRYLNAYIVDDNGNRTLPTPLSWYKDKSQKIDDGYTIFDKSHPDFNKADFLDDEEIKQPKTHKAEYCMVDDETATLYEPARQINIHTRREDRSAGRATDDDFGAVFRYDALAAGQLFSGVILCEADNDAEALLNDLNQTELVIGGSRSGGYGRAHVSKVEKISNWHETENISGNISEGEIFTLTLLSDMIVRDENGLFIDILSAKTVSDGLGVDETVIDGPQKIYRETAPVGGFNRKWGLPLPQNLAMRAGSVFTFKTTVDISANAIETLLWDGIGERRAEGFGRVAINWIEREKVTAANPTGKSTLLEKPKPDAESLELAQRMNERLFCRNADRALIERANEVTINKTPKRSQLGGLRVEIRKAMQASDIESLKEYLEEMKPTAKKQFEGAQIKGASSDLHAWLLKQLEHPDDIWRLQLKNVDNNPLQLESTSFDPANLATEYTLRLIDMVLAKAGKEKQDD